MRFRDWQRPAIVEGLDTRYGWRVRHVKRLLLGYETDIGYGTYIQAEETVVIGNNVQIGGHCLLYSVNTINNTRGPIVIGDDACIGAFCTILPGVTIGRGAFVRAYTLVTKDIEPGAKVGGFCVV